MIKKKQLELEILEKFSKHHPSKLNIASMRSVNPPKPDIEINTECGETIAFELSELVDREMIRRIQTQLKINRLCTDYYKNLPKDKKNKFESRYGHNLIYIFFEHGISSIKKERNIDSIFDYLLTLNPIEEKNIPQNRNLRKIIKKIHLLNTKLPGPRFTNDAAGGIACPLIDRIQEKFGNEYRTTFPCELLLYYDILPEIVSEFKFDDACEYAQNNITFSPFRKIWIYSAQKDKILKEINKTL
ncbi:MAG: hypothetical protein JSV30_03275 [Candidatus Omnitrophota bacterium]|nr:MAG: hypothetical protein JSV30_03275 [Candidatus Omnitrophota bacterium]